MFTSRKKLLINDNYDSLTSFRLNLLLRVSIDMNRIMRVLSYPVKIADTKTIIAISQMF